MTRSSKSSSIALQPHNSNIEPNTPLTPGKQVRKLKGELEKKDAENEALRNSVADLNKALGCLNLANEKIATLGSSNILSVASTADADGKKKKKDENAPIPAITAYKYFSNATPHEEGIDMRQLWKECDPTQRQKFMSMAKYDKVRFENEMISFEEEKAALSLYYSKQKEDAAMEFYEAHIAAQTAIDNADANKKGKKNVKKDPEAPKRPISSYFYFASEKRDAVKKKNGDVSITEISKLLGVMWNKLEKGKKGKNGTKKYDDLAAKDKIRYTVEKAAYDEMIAKRKAESDLEKISQQNKDKEEAMKLMNTVKNASNIAVPTRSDDMSVISDITLTAGANNNSKKPRKKKDPNAPKKNWSAYIYFSTESRNEIKASMPEGTKQTELLTEIGRKWKELSEVDKEKFVLLANTDKERYAKEMEIYKEGKKE
mmetsp:Transcript_24550/g.28959  ORF Transcript_24550/g.28959 Transcript_24550/m.28959 type:complete len:429 (-) Transcript_24550:132-1418(-)|eukprot:CAMPEP_0198267578 /NCGR_PEP_ID=MMETSP1447-20131203/33659_1 /TAXON_ID=420782 /ORGANISM="Chaetoceros dichaeta, Strain CCMP1751" /LENGTH=428 /DNA_ID=CAMNT_0043958241 /DNA_START=32 /DNA_END=1318 /DNA_ORIENTATION=+